MALSFRLALALILGLLFLTTACDEDKGPALLAITSPASGSEVSGSVPVQVSVAENAGDVSVRLYARGVGGQERRQARRFCGHEASRDSVGHKHLPECYAARAVRSGRRQ